MVNLYLNEAEIPSTLISEKYTNLSMDAALNKGRELMDSIINNPIIWGSIENQVF
jgi:hypothetical protein